jgi:REP element-mobilizing transposase RayT
MGMEATWGIKIIFGDFGVDCFASPIPHDESWGYADKIQDMRHSHTRIWIHLVWATKNRERMLFKHAGKPLYDHLLTRSEELGIPFQRLNIQPEHVHGLIDLPSDQCLADFMKKIKGESAHWLNEQRLLPGRFAWQRGYGGYSVSASQFDVVKTYIQNQTGHHKRRSFAEEYEEWKRRYGIFDD